MITGKNRFSDSENFIVMYFHKKSKETATITKDIMDPKNIILNV